MDPLGKLPSIWPNTTNYKHRQLVQHLQVKNTVVSVNLECAGRKKQDKEDASVVGEERMKEWQGQSKSLKQNYKVNDSPFGMEDGKDECLRFW